MNFNRQILGAAVIICLAITACNDQDNQNTNAPAAPDTTTGPIDNTNTAPAPVTDTSAMVADANKMSSDVPKKGKKGSVSIKSYEVNKKDKMEADATGVYPYAEVMPSFPGGEKALGEWISDHITYPEEAIENNIEGDITVAFAVDEMGKVYTPQVIGQKLGYGLDEEAVNIVNKMPKWNPGRIKGKNVKTRFTLPISFQLR